MGVHRLEKARADFATALSNTNDQRISPAAFGLVRLTAHRSTYPCNKMCETLLEVFKRQSPHGDIAAKQAELSKMKTTPLRELMVLTFYGVDFMYVKGITFAPMNDTAEAQTFARDWAVKNGWVPKRPAAAV